MQNLPGLGETFVKYDYDLISGRVKEVILQEGEVDEFRYRYSYDDDGRLLTAESSTDGVIWEKDAKYAYYAHGPLRRVELGDDRIQGVDYTYTIQGWLKAINHPAPDASHTPAPSPGPAYDPGVDGTDFAADAFAMTLGYFPGDFANYSGGVNSAFNQLQDWSLHGSPLYNGNISSWTSNVFASGVSGKQYEQLTGYTYEYDLLNRIKQADFHSWNSSTDVFDAATDYSSSYSYDPNGNLETLKRRGNSGTLFDDFSYNYDTGNNKLLSVADAVTNSATLGDIESGQSSGNYTYDNIGNLTADAQEGISEIDWTAYGKIRSVEETDSTRIVYTYDAAGNRVMKRDSMWSGSAFVPEKDTWYIRDAAGTVLSQYEKSHTGADTTTKQSEVPLYGGKRLGLFRPEQARWASLVPGNVYTRYADERQFELSDHLGNVRAVVGDVKEPVGSNFKTDLQAYNNYYPFGMLQPDRTWNSAGYRHGFNGMEMDNEVKGEGNSYTTFHRGFDPRIGRWMSVDPAKAKFPGMSPYSGMANDPLRFVDAEGDIPIIPFVLIAGVFLVTPHAPALGPEDESDASSRAVREAWSDVSNAQYTALAITATPASASALGQQFLVRNVVVNVSAQTGVIQGVNLYETGELLSAGELAAHIDIADVGLGMFGGAGWTGALTNVVLPSAVDYQLGEGPRIAGVNKKAEHILIDLTANGIFYGVGQKMLAGTNVEMARLNSEYETNMLISNAYHSADNTTRGGKGWSMYYWPRAGYHQEVAEAAMSQIEALTGPENRLLILRVFADYGQPHGAALLSTPKSFIGENSTSPQTQESSSTGETHVNHPLPYR